MQTGRFLKKKILVECQLNLTTQNLFPGKHSNAQWKKHKYNKTDLLFKKIGQFSRPPIVLKLW